LGSVGAVGKGKGIAPPQVAMAAAVALDVTDRAGE